jgi:putative PIN family toxin of toxin-antitoxin system
MRVVVDTNISLLIRPGETFHSLIDHLDQHATILYSTDTLTELVDVLRRTKFAKYPTPEEVAVLVTWLAEAGELVTVADDVAGSRDATGNKFLSLALAGRADYLVSGDKDLLVLGTIGTIPILSPADLLAAVAR